MVKESKILIDRSIYSYYYNQLLESKHIVDNFNDVVYYISKHISEFPQGVEIYTGWNWHISQEKCTNDKSENSGYPIYIIIEKLKSYMFARMDLREMNKSKILIHVNIDNIYDDDFESKLNHEFTHVRTSYSRYFLDPLESVRHRYDISPLTIYKKNDIYYNQYVNGSQEIEFGNNYFYGVCSDILYLLSRTEQEARINQTYKFIVHKYANNNDRPTEKQLMDEVNNKRISLVNDLFFYHAKCFGDLCIDYDLSVFISYYLCKYGHCNKKFNISLFTEYLNNGKNKQIEDLVNTISDSLYRNCFEYEQKIRKIIKQAIHDISEKTLR